uniref:RNA polymerase II subunit A C-terminal domain phosphatase n=1 Tax=Plectus sambesii TaxID=2011161 RepID=A0A914V1Z5_9BILA
MCGDCGEDLRLNEQIASAAGPEARGAASVAMIHHIPELVISPEMAKEQGRIDMETVLKQRKLFLLVDLDQTLIHTTNEFVNDNIEDVFHYQLYGTNSPAYHTRLRPHMRHFLESMFALYEMHICTFGQRMYAHTIAKFLDPDGKLFGKRILSRDECFDPTLKTANLKALFPCGDHLTAIIDDREDVWQFADNLVHVKPYRFFKHTGDINAPPQATKTNENTEHQFQF